MDVDANRSELEAWLVLMRAPGVGAAALHERIARHGSALAALDAARGETAGNLAPACRAWLRSPDRARIAGDLDWLGADGHTLLTSTDADFPALLGETPGAPCALFVAGNVASVWNAQIAIVGSRSASTAGLDNARRFAHAFATAGFAITSGLAEGIDAAAHEAALERGAPTIAVLGTGPDLVYPVRHRALAERIAESGALVSEFPPGTPGRPENFPRRNRIIAGLALGTLVVEAGLRSGSLITARNAAEQGRDVFAIPGSIHHPLARGCHRLIRQGAMLVETADEIVEALRPLAARLDMHLRERLGQREGAEASATAEPCRAAVAASIRDPDSARVLAAIGHEALGVDMLAARTGLPAAVVSALLLLLELDGEVAAETGGRYARRRQADITQPDPNRPVLYPFDSIS